MSYCKSCGAYIPDWEDACPACGEPKAEPKKRTSRKSAASGATAQAETRSGEYHYSYKKAGPGQERPDAARPGAREGAYDEEKLRRDTAYYAGQYKADAEENKLLAALCYLGPFFLLSWLMKPKSKFVRYHVNQGLVLFLCWIVINIFDFIPFMWLANIFGVVCFFCGIANALKGRRKPLPIIGEITLIK